MSDTMTQPVETATLVTVTGEAALRLQKLKEEKQLGSEFALRVFVAGGGCSGLQYGMTFDNEVRDGDTEFAQQGMRILVDSMSAQYIGGANIDYIDELMGGGFKIDNPNAVASCGCGSSFRPKEGAEGAAAQGGCGSGCGCG